MTSVVTLTSKRQLTIPAALFEALGFSTGDRLVVEKVDNELRLRKAIDLVNELAGSVKVDAKLKHVSPDEAIRLAKQKRFSK